MIRPTRDPFALWGRLSAEQRAALTAMPPLPHCDPVMRSLARLALTIWTPELERWQPTPLGARVAQPPVVFLDMDGVVARVRETSGFERIEEAAVRRLNPIVRTGARFVLSSSWREGAPIVRIGNWLRAKGFEGSLVDATPVLGDVPREEEIQAWLDAQPVQPRAFAILDDWPMVRLAHRAVLTDHHTLVTDADVDRVIALLTAPAIAAVELEGARP